MKKIATLTAVCFGTLVTAGCATDGSAYSKSQQTQPGEIVVNERYIAAVENIAKQRGTRVVWVNVPTKRAPDSLPVSD